MNLLIVEDDRELLALLSTEAAVRAYRVVTAATLRDAHTAISTCAVDLALIDLGLGSESGLDMIRQIKECVPGAEIVVISGSTSLASAIESYELAAFAFVQKPFDNDQLFGTLGRALERRRMNSANRRLVWELKLINDIGADLRRTLDPRELLADAVRRLVAALSATGGSARLLNIDTGEFETVFTQGPPRLRSLWGGPQVVVPRPSDRVIATRTSLSIPDLHALVSPDLRPSVPIRSALCVPVFAGDELVGTISIGSDAPDRYTEEDERLLSIIAGQIGVAVQNGRLHLWARIGKQQWEATFDAISDPIAVFDGGGRLLRANTALARHLSRPVNALKGLTCDEVGLCGGTFPACAVGRAAAEGGGLAEATLPDARIFSVTTCPVPDIANGASVVQIAKDVTQEINNARRLRQMSEELAATNERLVATLDRLKTTQAQLLQAEKLSAIGQLVAGVAHELNNPLTSVIGYAQLVEEELLSPPPGEAPRSPAALARDLRRIAEESERAARIVRNLLAFARRQTAERAPHDVADLLARVLALRTYEFRLSGIELETAFEPDLPRVLADGGQLQQALLNLILNAEQALRGRSPRGLRVGARYIAPAAAVELFVADTGHGIADENLRKIFDPFFTTRDVGEGTGLGLSICYGIVRDHGGEISVQSRNGIGTTFSLTLPAHVDAAAGDRRQVLVAHCDPAERDYLAAILAGWGHEVAAIDNAPAALARYRAGGLGAAFVEHGVIAADVAGWRAARQSDAAPALVLMTSGEEDGEVLRFGRDQATAIVSPPFELRVLRAALHSVSRECV